MPVSPCPSCQRSVREDSETCPFCRAPMHDRMSVRLKTPDEDPPAPVYGMPPIDAGERLPPVTRRGSGWLVIVMVVAAVIGFVFARFLAE